jgi:hypothetical protein
MKIAKSSTSLGTPEVSLVAPIGTKFVSSSGCSG